jgi:hypothetical protein
MSRIAYKLWMSRINMAKNFRKPSSARRIVGPKSNYEYMY